MPFGGLVGWWLYKQTDRQYNFCHFPLVSSWQRLVCARELNYQRAADGNLEHVRRGSLDGRWATMVTVKG